MAKRDPLKPKSGKSFLQIDGVGLQGISSPINSVQTVVVPITKNPEVGSAKLAKKAKTIEQLFAERSKLSRTEPLGLYEGQPISGSISIPAPSDSDGHDPKGLERFSNGKPLDKATATDFLIGLTTTSGSSWEGFDINTKDATGRVRLNELKREALKLSWDAHAQARQEKREAFQDQWSVEGAAARRRARGQSQPQEPRPRAPTQEELVAEALAAVASGEEKADSFGGFYGLDSKGKYHKFPRQSDFYGGCSHKPRAVRADDFGGTVNMGVNFADDPRRKALKEQWAANEAARRQHNAEVKRNFDNQWSVEAAAARKPPQPTQKELVADAIAALDAGRAPTSNRAPAGNGAPTTNFTPDSQNTVAANNPPKQHKPTDYTKVEPQGQAEIAKAIAIREGYIDEKGNLTPEREAAMQKEMAENPDKTIGYLWGVRQDKLGQMESRIQNRVNNDRINDFNKANIEAAKRGEGQGWSSNRSAIKAPGHTESDAEWEKAWDNVLSGNEGRQMRDAIDGRIDRIQDNHRSHKGNSRYQQRAGQIINSIYVKGAPEVPKYGSSKDVMDFTPSKPISNPFGSTLANARVNQLRDRADYKALESRGAGFFTGPSKLPSSSKLPSASESTGSMIGPTISASTKLKHDAVPDLIGGTEEQTDFFNRAVNNIMGTPIVEDSVRGALRERTRDQEISDIFKRSSSHLYTGPTDANIFLKGIEDSRKAEANRPKVVGWGKEYNDRLSSDIAGMRRAKGLSNDRFNSTLRPYPQPGIDRFRSELWPGQERVKSRRQGLFDMWSMMPGGILR